MIKETARGRHFVLVNMTKRVGSNRQQLEGAENIMKETNPGEARNRALKHSKVGFWDGTVPNAPP